MGRFVKIFDNIEEWQHFKRNNFLQVWILLLMDANYKESYDSYGRKIHVGQVVLSQNRFAERCGITKPTLSNILKSLEKSGEITMNTKRNYTLVTIMKYKNYQQDKFVEDADESEFTDKTCQENREEFFGTDNECQQSYLVDNEYTYNGCGKKILPPPLPPPLHIIRNDRNDRNDRINLKRDKEKKISSKIENETMSEIELEEDEKISAKQKTEEGGSHSEDGKSVGGCVPQTQYAIRAEESKEYLMGLGREWRDSVKMFLRIGDDDGKLDLLITMFCAKLRSEGSPPKSENQLRGHFNNWARIFLSDERKEERSLSRGGSVSKSGGDCFSAYAHDIDGKNFAESWDKYLNKKR